MSGSAEPNKEEDPVAAAQAEEDHFRKVIESLLFYKQHATERLTRAQRSFDKISKEHQDMLTQFKYKLEGLYRAVDANNSVMVEVVSSNPFGICAETDSDAHPRPSGADMEKVYTTIKQFVRDWSAEGASERAKCYTPVLDAIDDFFKDRDNSTISIVVPGSGLGRLAWELANRGYCSQGNEWSVFMLLASNYVLNGARGVHHIKLYPYAHQFSNNFTVQDQLRSVTVPDVDPSSLPSNSNGFSMAAGDFLEIYTDEGAWDCISSCFFLDTARNPIVYLQKMFNILKPGGILVNLGPLLYHFADNQEAPSVELCYDEMKEIIKSVGFVFLSEKYPHNSPYIDNEMSMLSMSYKCVLFVVQKPIGPIPAPIPSMDPTNSSASVLDPIAPPNTNANSATNDDDDDHDDEEEDDEEEKDEDDNENDEDDEDQHQHAEDQEEDDAEVSANKRCRHVENVQQLKKVKLNSNDDAPISTNNNTNTNINTNTNNNNNTDTNNNTNTNTDNNNTNTKSVNDTNTNTTINTTTNNTTTTTTTGDTSSSSMAIPQIVAGDILSSSSVAPTSTTATTTTTTTTDINMNASGPHANPDHVDLGSDTTNNKSSTSTAKDVLMRGMEPWPNQQPPH